MARDIAVAALVAFSTGVMSGVVVTAALGGQVGRAGVILWSACRWTFSSFAKVRILTGPPLRMAPAPPQQVTGQVHSFPQNPVLGE